MQEAEKIIKALKERIKKDRNCPCFTPENASYDYMEGQIVGLELAISIVNELIKNK